MMMRQEELEALQKIFPFAPLATLLIYLEPSLVARVAAESFAFDSNRTVMPPLDGLNVPELRSTILAVDAGASLIGAYRPSSIAR